LPGYRASAPSRATDGGFAVSPVDATRSLSPLPRQGQRIGQDRQKRRCCPQIGDNLWTTQNPGRGSPSQASLGSPAEKLRLIRWGRAGSSMEGTSGAADLALLRGRTGDAALGPGWRLRHPCRSGPRDFPARRPRASGPSGAHEPDPSRGSGTCGVIVKGVCLAGFLAGRRRRRRSLHPMRQRSRDKRCPSGSGWGKALAKREVPPVNAGRSLARETSAGDRHRSRKASAARPRSGVAKTGERASVSRRRRDTDENETKATVLWQLPASESSRGGRSAQAHARGVGSLAAPRPEGLLSG
jgi:hypothetical protein